MATTRYRPPRPFRARHKKGLGAFPSPHGPAAPKLGIEVSCPRYAPCTGRFLMRRFVLSPILLSWFFGCRRAWAGPSRTFEDTRLLSQPASSPARRLHLCRRSLGRRPRRPERPAADQRRGRASRIRSSRRTGASIAFSAQYDGNIDVYMVPVAGGPPQRLTWHPAADIVRGFTPDGKAVLFSSPRHVFTHRYTQLFTVPLGRRDARRNCRSRTPSRPATRPTGSRSPTRRWPTARAVEALPRRHALADLDLSPRRPSRRADPAARGPLQRSRPELDRRDDLFPLRPQRRVQPVRLRHPGEDRPATDHARRFPGAQRRLGRRPADLRAGGLSAPVRPGQRARARG